MCSALTVCHGHCRAVFLQHSSVESGVHRGMEATWKIMLCIYHAVPVAKKRRRGFRYFFLNDLGTADSRLRLEFLYSCNNYPF